MQRLVQLMVDTAHGHHGYRVMQTVVVVLKREVVTVATLSHSPEPRTVLCWALTGKHAFATYFLANMSTFSKATEL